MEDGRPFRILAVKLSSLGDVVRVTPCLRALRAWRPEAEISLAVDASLAPLLHGDPAVDHVLENAAGGVVRAWRSARRVAHAGPFDLALDFQGNRRSVAWMVGVRARERAGRGSWRPGWRCAVPERLSVNDVPDQAHILERLGIPVTDFAPRLCVNAEADARVERMLAGRGVPPSGFLVLNPFGRWASKTWPPARFVEVVRRFAAQFAAPVVLTGGPAERDEAAAFVASAPAGAVVSLAGGLSLPEAVALYRRAGLMLTGDSGPMHAAAAVGARVIALFGPTWPERSGPWGPGHRVIQARRPSRHRAYRDAGARACMLAITVESVWEALAAAWVGREDAVRP